MKSKHFFVPVLDVAGLIPFSVKLNHDIKEDLVLQSKSEKELEKFIRMLDNSFRETAWYMGFDVIGEKFYERFMFDKGGFFEVMMEHPAAMVGHFTSMKRAEKFASALRKALSKVLPKTTAAKLFIEDIKASSAEEYELKVEKWSKIKEI